MTMSLAPGDSPVSLNEARGWLRMGAVVDDAVVAQLLRARGKMCRRPVRMDLGSPDQSPGIVFVDL